MFAAHGAAAESALLLPAERVRLIELTRKDDAAHAAFAELQRQANLVLGDAPRPIKKIQTEGKLAGDPVKVATSAAMKDMPKLFALGYVYVVAGETKYADEARALILGWAGVNEPTGDPIDETGLEPLIVAYDLTHDTFSTEEQNVADGYLRKIIAAEWGAKQRTNNWQSHRLKVIGLAAFVLHDDAEIARALAGFKAQVAVDLNPDGSSFDFHERDALHYHVYDLEPLLALAIAAQKHGVNLYDYTSEEGASLRRSVHFLIPFCTGEKQHGEFVNSKVKFDRQRAENGEKGYVSGHLFTPEEGFKALSLAAYFDPAADPVIHDLLAHQKNLADRWALVLNAVSQNQRISTP